MGKQRLRDSWEKTLEQAEKKATETARNNAELQRMWKLLDIVRHWVEKQLEDRRLKLSEADREEIIRQISVGVKSTEEIAEEFEVSTQTIRNVGAKK